MRDGDELVLMELEALDPELYLRYAPEGVERWADAVAALV